MCVLCAHPHTHRYAYDLRPVAATGLPDERFSVNYRLYIIQEYCDAGSLAHAIDAGAFMDLGKRNLVSWHEPSKCVCVCVCVQAVLMQDAQISAHVCM